MRKISKNLSVRSWGAGFGLLCLALVACAPNDLVPNRVAKKIIQPDCAAGCIVYTDDPNPDSVGVWMSDYFTAANCYGGVYDDNDHDGIGDQCEWALAKRFAPIMINEASTDDNVGGVPYWAARPSTDSSIVILYMPAYYLDLGCSEDLFCGYHDIDTGHIGDSEAIGIVIKWHGGSKHWVVTAASLSQHSGYDFHSGSPYASGLEYPTEVGGPFRVHVSWGKHANFPSKSACNADVGDDTNEDICFNSSSSGDTLYVGSDRNVGSSSYQLNNCVYSGIPYDEYQECFWTGEYFLGWQYPYGGSTSPYSARLTSFGFIN